MKLTPTLQKAINKAAILHKGQFRKGEDRAPYFTHLVSVMIILSGYTSDEDVLVAALLHDVLEDVPGYYEADMQSEFGDRVTDIVKGVSEEKDPNADVSTLLPWKERKLGYLATVGEATDGSVMVSAADKIHNLNSMVEAYKTEGEAIWEKFSSPQEEKLWFYEEVLKVVEAVSYTHLRAHETDSYLVCRLLLEKKKTKK